MEKQKPEVISINDDDDDNSNDGPECKPTEAKKKKNTKKKTKRKVEKTINTSSQTETLVVTQTVRKQHFQCIINLTNICEHKKKPKHKHKPRTDKVNTKEAKKKKVDKIVPSCLRHRCKIDVKRKNDTCIERNHKKESDRKKLDESCRKLKSFEKQQLSESCEKRDKSNMSTKYKVTRDKPRHRKSHRQRRVEPRQGRSLSHTRYLSPISPGSLSDVLSECNEDILSLSYEDISSDSTIEIDTLIKRTKDREKNSSIHGYYIQSGTSLRDNYDIPSAKVTKKHDTRKISHSFKKAELEFNKSNKNKCAVKPITHRPRYDYVENDIHKISHSFKKAELEFNKSNKNKCAVKPITNRQRLDYVENIANIPLPMTNKPSGIIEQTIDHKYDPILTSIPKYDDNIETLDASATDEGTVLTGEMDIVSFHSQGTLVLDYSYSPSHSNESPISMKYNVYSPTMSPVFFKNEDIPESLHRVLMSPALTPLIPNSFEIASLKRYSPYSTSRSPLSPFNVAHFNQNERENSLDKLGSKNKQEQHVKSNKIKLERISPETDIIDGSIANITSINFDINNVKVEAKDVPEKNNPFESMKSYVTIKEEINDVIINNNQPYKRLDLSMRFINNSEDDNLRIKKED